MMKTIISIFSLFMILGTVVAQTETRITNTVQGKIINEATNEPVAYTNVGIEDTYFGTASDEDGNFKLKIPEEMTSRQIFFSSVGFRSLKIPVASLFEKEFNIIKLIPQTYDIEKIDIEGRSMVIARILRMASENTPYNYMSGPFNLICSYHREQIINDSTIIAEPAELIIYDESGYRTPSKSDAFKMRTYKINKSQSDYTFSEGIINLDELLELDWVRNATSVLNPALSERFIFTIIEEPVIDEKPAWTISFSETNPTLAGSQDFHATEFKGEITIFKDDYSVREIKGSVKSNIQHRQGKSLAVSNKNTNYLKDVAYTFTVSYANLIPEEITLHKQYNYNSQDINEKSKIQVNSFQVENINKIVNRDYFAE